MKATRRNVVLGGLVSLAATAAALPVSAADDQMEPLGGQPAPGSKPSVADLDYQVKYQRAFEAVIWAVPAVAIYRFAKGIQSLGLKPNDIIAFGKPATPNAELLTANNQVPYTLAYTDLRDGPVVLELPAATEEASLYGQIVDAWQVTVADVGPSGADRGKGGKYLLLPAGYDKAIPDGYLPVQTGSIRVYFAFRSVPGPKGSIEKAAAYSRTLSLVAVDAARVTRTRPGNLDAEDLALRCEAGVYNSPSGSAEFTAAFDLCDRALHIDNGNVVALTGMTLRYIVPVIEAQSSDPQADIGRANELVLRALAIDPNFYVAHFAKAYVLVAQGRTQEAVAEGERSLSLNPSFIDAYVALCSANNFLGRPDRALELADKAIRLSPRDPSLRELYHMKGWAFFMKQQDDQAIDWLRRAEGGDVFTELILAAALALTGQQADAHETLKRYLAVKGVTTTTIAQLRKQQLALADNSTWVAYNERLFEGLRKAGMPEE